MTTARSLALALVAGVAVAGFSVWPGDIPLLWGIALGIPAAAVTVLGARMSGPLEPSWAAEPDLPSPATEMQSANLATRFAEAAGDQTRFVSRVQPRLRRLALARLRERHPDLSDVDDPRARAVLGVELHRLLTSPGAALPSPQRMAELLDRLEET
ncbi:hypothetical protein [Actinokineospora sp.]|uniref:hypothetical protein n=1 Tax=Actinokineospora sp. TaxID=1872133 RepID=UPI0040380467